MRHPSTRADRRCAWSLARTRYRNKLKLFAASNREQPERNQYWNRGGKQCEAHGNRCAHSLIERQKRRTLIKASRGRSRLPNIRALKELDAKASISPR